MELLKNKRLWIDVVIFVSAFVAPWWLSCIVALAAAFYFPRFFEIIILGILLDSLYTGPAAWFWNFPFAMTFLALVAFFVIRYAKTFIRVDV